MQGESLMLCGYYEDVFALREEGWRIENKTLVFQGRFVRNTSLFVIYGIWGDLGGGVMDGSGRGRIDLWLGSKRTNV